MNKEQALKYTQYQLKDKLFKEIRESVILWETNESSFDVIINNLCIFREFAETYKDIIETLTKACNGGENEA